MQIATSEVMFGKHQSSSWADVLKPVVEIFDDRDSNLLEYIAKLDDEPQPELGLLLSWSEWLSGRKKAK